MKDLAPGRWAPENRERLNEIIRRSAFQGRYACFDYDDTTSVHAVDHALFVYQLHTLRFAMDPRQMREALTAGLSGPDRVLGQGMDGQPVRCVDIVEDLCRDYRLLWRSRAVGAGEAGRFGTVTLTSPEERPGAAGRIRTVEETGLTFPEEIRDLYRTLRENGITPYLVSASPAELVRAGSELAGLGVPPEQIYAMRARQDRDGRYICSYDYGWNGGYVQTFGAGKSRVIARFIAPRHGGRGPLLVCGDAESDMNMMTDWMARGDTEAGLIFNHLRDSVHHPRLSRAAREAAARPGGRFLLQGLDKRTGTFCPTQTTIPEDSGKARLFAGD